jgi:hypothetical protein
MATMEGYETVIQLLLKTGANIEAQDENGRTALHMAAVAGREALVQLLLKTEADVKAKDKDKHTARDIVVAMVGHEGVVELLKEAELKVLQLAKVVSRDSRYIDNGFTAAVAYFSGSSEVKGPRSVQRPAVATIMEGKLIQDRTYGQGSDMGSSFRWLHLPANNVSHGKLQLELKLKYIR